MLETQYIELKDFEYIYIHIYQYHWWFTTIAYKTEEDAISSLKELETKWYEWKVLKIKNPFFYSSPSLETNK